MKMSVKICRKGSFLLYPNFNCSINIRTYILHILKFEWWMLFNWDYISNPVIKHHIISRFTKHPEKYKSERNTLFWRWGHYTGSYFYSHKHHNFPFPISLSKLWRDTKFLNPDLKWACQNKFKKLLFHHVTKILLATVILHLQHHI
jgi:hypothetical protein